MPVWLFSFLVGTATAAELDARWTSSTIPAIAVHLADQNDRPVVGARVVFRGPDGAAAEGYTNSKGSITRVFLPVGDWQVSVYGDSGPTHDLLVQLASRQRADLDLIHTADAAHSPVSAAVLRAPVVETHEASRGSRWQQSYGVLRTAR